MCQHHAQLLRVNLELPGRKHVHAQRCSMNPLLIMEMGETKLFPPLLIFYKRGALREDEFIGTRAQEEQRPYLQLLVFRPVRHYGAFP